MRLAASIVLGILVTVSSPVLGRAEEPVPDPLSASDGLEAMEEPPTTGRVHRAVGAGDSGPAIPGVVLPDYRPTRGSVLPEGTYLLRRRGIVVPIGEERWAYVFDPDVAGERESPMFLMPSLQLSEMVRLAQSRSDTITFFLDGEVFVYDGRNHLLPIRYDIAADESLTRAEEVDATLEANHALSVGSDDEDPSVESLLDRLDRAADDDEKSGAVRGPAPVSEEGTSDLIPERTSIVSRRGRLVRADGARWTFVTDNDADRDAGQGEDAGPHAFILQPCLNTQDLERLADRHADRVVFVVSGAIFVFEGRNYLLPTMYLIEHDRDGNLNPGQ